MSQFAVAELVKSIENVWLSFCVRSLYKRFFPRSSSKNDSLWFLWEPLMTFVSSKIFSNGKCLSERLSIFWSASILKRLNEDFTVLSFSVRLLQLFGKLFFFPFLFQVLLRIIQFLSYTLKSFSNRSQIFINKALCFNFYRVVFKLLKS